MTLYRVSKILSIGRLMGFVLSEDSIGCPDLGIDLFEVECDPSQRWLLEFHCVFHGTQTVDSILLSDKRRIVTSGIESSFKSTQTMNICINELCRTAGFDFIDFENSFVYGTNTATKETISTEADFSSSRNFLIDWPNDKKYFLRVCEIDKSALLRPLQLGKIH